MKTNSMAMGAGLALALSVALPTSAATVALHIEESTNLTHWAPLPATLLPIAPDGALLHTSDAPNKSYRLRIDGASSRAGAIPLANAPATAVRLATGHLAGFGDVEVVGDPDDGPRWDNVELGPVCWPVFDPAYEGGNAPAYIEFKVVSRPPVPGAGGFTPPPTGREGMERGYVLVCLHPGDYPIVAFGEDGPTPVEQLARRVPAGVAFKPLRIDENLLVAEDSAGRLVGSLGTHPFKIDDAIVNIAGTEFGGPIGTGAGGPDTEPRFPVSAFASYAELRHDVVERPLFKKLRMMRKMMARKHWDIANGLEPKELVLGPGDGRAVFEGRLIAEIHVEDPSVAVVRTNATGIGATIAAQADGETAVTALFADGSLETCLVAVTAPQLVAAGSWTGWTEYYAGNWTDQREYYQLINDNRMCSDAASGCGPTAWAMLYGWWDRKSVPKLIGNPNLYDASKTVDVPVGDCLAFVFNRVGPLCISVNGQAATMPWDMKKGYQWGDFRGAGRTITYKWGAPYLCPEARALAGGSVKNGKPSILGIGFYWHYVLAYGHKYRKYVGSLGTVWNIDRWYKCNMGWGRQSGEWRNGDSIWFATDARFTN